MIRVLYHADCLDGFGAALAAYMKFGAKATYRACRYDEGALPLDGCPDGDEVYVLDFSFKREVILREQKRLNLRIIDHHKSAKEDLEGLDCCIFNMEKSGAVLAYEFFFPGLPVPWLFLVIQDRDLWQWKLPGTKEITAALYEDDRSFELWLMSLHNTNVLELKGASLVRKMENDVRRTVETSGWLAIGGHEVPAANSVFYPSEVGHALCAKYPDRPFSVTFFDRSRADGGWLRTYSLRSIGEYDVSALARQFGGGGHKTAAGFSVAVSMVDL
jgi:hypothetical protein